MGLLITPLKARAVGEFITSFATTYSIDVSGETTVSQKVTLTNQLSDVYAAEYALEIGSTRIEDVVAFGQTGNPIPVSVTQTESKTVVVVTFDEQVVGINRQQIFTIRYKNPDAAQKVGNVLEVGVPRLANNSEVDSFEVNLEVPLVFGQPTLVNPSTFSQQLADQKTIISFGTDEIRDKGITAIFGQQQVFEFSLNYNLENPTVSEGITQLALPPDTAYQRIFFDNIDPKPQEIQLDKDGNWIGTFFLEPKAKITVNVKGSAILYLEPTVPVAASTETASYLLSQKYWEVTDPSIVSLARELKTPRAIYDYLVDNFTYNYDRVERGGGRLGALTALNEPHNAICTEFTDAYVALARAAGIPSRELNGYAYTENSVLRPLSLVEDVLHAWPEYYDEERKTWIPIDPTWGNTTGGVDYFDHLDFNHLVLTIHGLDSEKPFSAGYYKFSDQESKDVYVEFSSVVPQERIEYEVSLDQGGWNWWSWEQTVRLLVENKSNVALYNQVYNVGGDNLRVANEEIQADTLLPYSKTEVPVGIVVIDRSKPARLIIELPNNESRVFNIEGGVVNGPTYVQAGTGIVVGGIFAYIAYRTGSILVSRIKERSLVHRQSQESEAES